jgi:hypothetical protein
VPANFNNALASRYNGSDGKWANIYFHVPSGLLSQYQSSWSDMVTNAKSLTIIGDADSMI